MAEAIFNLKKEKLQAELLKAIGRVVRIKAMSLAPVDSTHLQNHIFADRIENGVIYIETIGCDYADKLEYGAPPSDFASLDVNDPALEKWAVKHGLPSGSGKGVVLGLKHRGIQVGTNKTTADAHRVDTYASKSPMHVTSLGRNSYRPFLRPAVWQSRTEMRQTIIDAKKLIIGALE